MCRALCSLAILVAFGAAPGRALAQKTFYVRVSGSDLNDGTSPDTAFRTIQFALKDRGTGKTFIVGPGTYREGDIRPDSGNSEEATVVFADRAGQLTGDPPGEVIIDATGFESGLRLPGRPFVIVNGFTVMNAREEGIFLKNDAHDSVVANCKVHSNGRDGIRVTDSRGVLVFNNLVYANAATGIEFRGESGSEFLPNDGSLGGAIINNTVYSNAEDGIRIEEAPLPSRDITILNNVITGNVGVGINLKEGSASGFVGQWNINTDGYNTIAVSRGRLDIEEVALSRLLVLPAGLDGLLGGSGHEDDDFNMPADSLALDGSPFKAKVFELKDASTQADGVPDAGRLDLGFHGDNATDFVKKKFPRKPFKKQLKPLRKKAVKCERMAEKADRQKDAGRGKCAKAKSISKFVKQCGGVVERFCL